MTNGIEIFWFAQTVIANSPCGTRVLDVARQPGIAPH